MKSKYPYPDFLQGLCTPEAFDHWLERKTRALLKRDRKRGNPAATRESYKKTIHEAIVRSQGLDEYTGLPLDWSLISTYDNIESKAKGRAYKKRLGNLPTVDHIGDGRGSPDFAICSWRVNDAKNDLSIEEFAELCLVVLNHRHPSRLHHISSAAQ